MWGYPLALWETFFFRYFIEKIEIMKKDLVTVMNDRFLKCKNYKNNHTVIQSDLKKKSILKFLFLR